MSNDVALTGLHGMEETVRALPVEAGEDRKQDS
jgi:hypothetical protein